MMFVLQAGQYLKERLSIKLRVLKCGGFLVLNSRRAFAGVEYNITIATP